MSEKVDIDNKSAFKVNLENKMAFIVQIIFLNV